MRPGPRISGSYTDWEFLYVPKFSINSFKDLFRRQSYAPLYERPRIRPKSHFTFWGSDGSSITCTNQDMIDGFTVPLWVPIATLGQINTVMSEILWVAAVHDKACAEQMGSRSWRAFVFKEAVWHGTYLVNQGDHITDRVLRRARALLLESFVTLGSRFGAC